MPRFRYKVLFLTSWYPNPAQPYNGIFVKRKAEALQHRADVAVLFAIGFSDAPGGYQLIHSVESGVRTWRVYYRPPSSNLGPLRALVERARYLRACLLGLKAVRAGFGRPDLVHLHVVQPAGYAALVLKIIAGLPYVLTEHCDLALRVSQGLQRISPFSRWLMRLVMQQAEVVTVDSTAMRQALKSEGLREDARVIGNIVETSITSPHHRRGSSRLRLVHVSSLWDRQKNVSGLLQAVAAAASQLGQGRLSIDIVGDGPDRENLQTLAVKLGLAGESVRFHGLQDEVKKKRIISQADCFVLSSRFEGFSVATAEALSAGLPVIVTDCGGPRDFVNTGNGIVVPPDDVQALTAAIVRMSLELGRYSRPGIRREARKVFDSAKVIRDILGVYDSMPVRWTAGLSWSRIKVNPEWLVLDVGSGHNPNSRADVLLDRDLEPSEHRTGQRTAVPEGRGMVVGDAAAMPFRGQAFDYAIASHIAEHVEDPGKLMSELQRVAREGYLETPGPLTEHLINVPYHRWQVRRSGGFLVFKRKKSYHVPWPGFFAFFNMNDTIAGRRTLKSANPLLVLLHRAITRAWKLLPLAYTRHHWSGAIRFQVLR